MTSPMTEHPTDALPLIFYDSPDRSRRMNSLAEVLERVGGRVSVQNVTLLVADLREAANPSTPIDDEGLDALITRLTTLYAQLGTTTKNYDADAVAEAIAAIEAIRASNGSRIAQALKLLDDVDSGAVELVCRGSGTIKVRGLEVDMSEFDRPVKLDSSDAR